MTSVSFHKVLWKNDELRLALLELDGNAPAPLALQEPERDADLAGRKAFVLGYPMAVAPNLPEGLRETVFGPALGKKAVMPGQFLPAKGNKEVAHDASTTSGVAGGPIVDELSGVVVGVHLQGTWLRDRKENQGTSIAALLADPEFRRVLKDSRVDTIAVLPAPATQATAPALLMPYNPKFLGVELPLPQVKANPKAKRLDYVHFSVLFDEERRMPILAAINVDRVNRLKLSRAPLPWEFDNRVATERQLGEAVYRDPEWDKGQLVSRLPVLWGPEPEARSAEQGVYYLTNSIPQRAKFNRMTWLKIEQLVYDKLHPELPKVTVFTGPVFSADDARVEGVQVPRAFWIVGIYADPTSPARPIVQAFMHRQYQNLGGTIADVQPAGIQQSEIDIRQLELLTGLKFNLP